MKDNERKGIKVKLTALTSPKFPALAKCALRLALELPAQTPHSARKQLPTLQIATRIGLGKMGDRTSSTMDESLKMSAANRYILHSGSSAVPSRCANMMVEMRPAED